MTSFFVNLCKNAAENLCVATYSSAFSVKLSDCTKGVAYEGQDLYMIIYNPGEISLYNQNQLSTGKHFTQCCKLFMYKLYSNFIYTVKLLLMSASLLNASLITRSSHSCLSQ